MNIDNRTTNILNTIANSNISISSIINTYLSFLNLNPVIKYYWRYQLFIKTNFKFARKQSVTYSFRDTTTRYIILNSTFNYFTRRATLGT